MDKEKTGPALPKLPDRRNWRGVLFGALILLCGMIGSGLTFYFLWHHVITIWQSPEKTTEKITSRLKTQLDLDDQQAAKIEKIIAQTRVDLHQIRRDAQPRVKEVLDKSKAEIERELKPDQVEKWNRIYEKTKHRWWHTRPDPKRDKSTDR